MIFPGRGQICNCAETSSPPPLVCLKLCPPPGKKKLQMEAIKKKIEGMLDTRIYLHNSKCISLNLLCILMYFKILLGYLGNYKANIFKLFQSDCIILYDSFAYFLLTSIGRFCGFGLLLFNSFGRR